jgi:hypothetical protein
MAETRTTPKRRSTRYDVTRDATLSLVARGVATVNEVAKLSGLSRQHIRYWAIQAGYTAATREMYLAEAWRKALKSAEKSS